MPLEWAPCRPARAHGGELLTFQKQRTPQGEDDSASKASRREEVPQLPCTRTVEQGKASDPIRSPADRKSPLFPTGYSRPGRTPKGEEETTPRWTGLLLLPRGRRPSVGVPRYPRWDLLLLPLALLLSSSGTSSPPQPGRLSQEREEPLRMSSASAFEEGPQPQTPVPGPRPLLHS